MSFIDLLSIFLPVLAFICVLLIVFINVYTKLCPRRSVKVNCWFCNQWSQILIEDQNSWDCAFCEQYNGFTKDGDYNKPIPEQHDELMNKFVPASTKTSLKSLENGLCNVCNTNQQLKVQQLAMFSPLDENKFEEEVDRYEKQLERAYRLCPQCEQTVKQTLQKQKSIVLGLRLSALLKPGLDYLNLDTGMSKTAKRHLFLTAIQCTTFAIAISRIFETVKSCDFSHENISKTLPNVFSSYLLLFKDLSILTYNIFSPLLECIFYLTGIVFNNFVYPYFENLHKYSFFPFDQNVIQLSFGLFLQSVFLMLSANRRVFDFVKFFIWGLLLYSCSGRMHQSYALFNVSQKIVEVALCCILTIAPSSKNNSTSKQSFKKSKKQSTCELNEFSDEELETDNETLLNSTFKIQESEEKDATITKTNNLFNISSNSIQLFNKKIDESQQPVFGQSAVFENPLNVSYFKYSPTQNENFANNSLNSSFYSDDNSIIKSPEQDLNTGLSALRLSTEPSPKRSQNMADLPEIFRVSSPVLMRPKPVLSPPRLRNVTQSSWVAGGYWKSGDFLNNSESFSNLSRSSSQSSGFGSQTSSLQPNYNGHVFNSLPSSRNNSICGDFDKFSVFSEPAYQYNSNLKSEKQIYICPKIVTSNKSSKSPILFDNRDHFWNNSGHFLLPNTRPCSRESNFSQYVNTPVVNPVVVSSTRPLSVNSVSSSVFSQPYIKGSLLQKWRDQNASDVHN